MAIRPSRVLALFAAVALSVTLTACTSSKSSSPAEQLPDGKALLGQSALAMSAVKSAHFTLRVEGELPGVNVRAVEGDLTSAGEAKGKAQIFQSGQLIETEFVLVGQALYLKGPTGGYQKLPASMVISIYDPSALLNAERGIPKLLSSASDVRTEGSDSVDGKDTYRIAIKVTKDVISALMPGINSDVSGKLWVGKDDKRMSRARFEVPDQQGKGPSAVTVDLSDFDKSVTITPPA